MSRRILVTCSVAILTISSSHASADAPVKAHVQVLPGTTGHAVTYYRIYCAVFLDENGSPKSVKALRTEPRIKMTQREMQAIAETVLTWKFKPIEKEGKPVAGSINMYLGVHLADPVMVDGT
jgi:hypothetical protein